MEFRICNFVILEFVILGFWIFGVGNFGISDLEFRIWNFGILDLDFWKFGIWNFGFEILGFGFLNLAFGHSCQLAFWNLVILGFFGIWNLEFANLDFSVPKMAPPGQSSENILVYLKWPGRGHSRLHILRGAFIFKGETQKLERNAHLGAKTRTELAKQIKTRSGMLTFFKSARGVRGTTSAPPTPRLGNQCPEEAL